MHEQKIVCLLRLLYGDTGYLLQKLNVREI